MTRPQQSQQSIQAESLQSLKARALETMRAIYRHERLSISSVPWSIDDRDVLFCELEEILNEFYRRLKKHEEENPF